jgi:hypothetical protein
MAIEVASDLPIHIGINFLFLSRLSSITTGVWLEGSRMSFFTRTFTVSFFPEAGKAEAKENEKTTEIATIKSLNFMKFSFQRSRLLPRDYVTLAGTSGSVNSIMNLRKVRAQRRPRGPARSAVLDPECSDRRELTTKPSAGASGLISLIVFIYHEDHEVF